MVAVGVGVCVGVEVAVGVGVFVGVLVGVGVSVGVFVGVGLGVSVGVFVGVSVGVVVGVCVGVSVGDSLGVMAGVSDGVGAGGGSIDERLFCGSASVRNTKSFVLLSVSSPLPSNSSAPPTPSVVLVEVGEAFRSMLPLDEGVATGSVSKSAAFPMPTLSSNVMPASLYNNIVVSLGMALVVAEYDKSGGTDPS